MWGKRDYRDSELGEWCKSDRGWELETSADGRPIRLWVDGSKCPDRDSAKAALEHLARLPELQAKVDTAFKLFCDGLPHLIEEQRLLITDIMMLSPQRGMLMLDSGRDDRLWRCDLVDGMVVELTFDT